MPAAILSREEVIVRVMTVVRRHGYEGASLAELSKATGLGKSSLYHHFPEGKDDMVGAVIGHLHATLEEALFTPLRGEGTPAARLQAMVATLDAFYRGGRESCVLAILGMGDAPRRFAPRVRKIFVAWVEAIAAVLRDAGQSPAAAESRAQDAIVRIEGAIVVARGLGDPSVFARTLDALPAALLRR